MRFLTLLLLILLAPASAPNLFSQSAIAAKRAAILKEGETLYRLEKAAWLATDLLREHHPKEMERFGGYTAYTDGEQTHCVFFTNDTETAVLADYKFDSIFSLATVQEDWQRAQPSDLEIRLLHLRRRAYQHIENDTIFKFYNNANLNVIPLIYEGIPKVYALTGPSVSGVVIFGNDYLLTFDQQDQVSDARALHRNIIPIEYNEEQTKTMHSHTEATGSLMTPTDVCTLMLYGPFTGWTSHTVLSATHWNIWTIESNSLAVISRKEIEKMGKKKKRKKKPRKKNKEPRR